ncbi:RDD family [Mycobacterium tuberculosis]|nr:RDD family [Mycobacterium tuberculosis]
MDGSQVGIGTMLLRVFVGMYLVYGITLGIGAIVSAIMVAAREDKRSIHDLIAGTYVTSNNPPQG